MIGTILLVATLIENAIAITNAATQIDAAIVAKGGTTEGGLNNAAAAIAALPSGGGGLEYPLNPAWPDIRVIMKANRHPTMTHAWIALIVPSAHTVNLYYSGSKRPNYLTSDGDSFYGDRVYSFRSNGWHWVIGREANPTFAQPVWDNSLNDSVVWVHYDDNFGYGSNEGSPVGYSRGCVYTGDNRSTFSNGNIFNKGRYFLAVKNARFINFYDTFYNNQEVEYICDINTEGADSFETSFNGCMSLRRITDTLDLRSATTSVNGLFGNCVSLTNCPTHFYMNGNYGQTPSFSSSQYIDTNCVAVIANGVVVGGMAYNLNDLTGASAPPTVTFHSNMKTRFGSNWDIVVDAFTAKGWGISPGK